MLPPGYACHFSVLTATLVVVVQRYRSWVGLICFRFGSLHGTFWYHENQFSGRRHSGPMGLVSEVLGVFSNWDLTFYLYGPTKGSNNNLFLLLPHSPDSARVLSTFLVSTAAPGCVLTSGSL